MKHLTLKLLLVSLVSHSFNSWGASPKLVNWSASGSEGCDASSVQLIENGGSISFLFGSFGPQLDAGARRRLDRRHCLLTMEVEMASNECVYRVDHLVRGGVLKSPGAKGRFHYTSFWNRKDRVSRTIKWAKRSEISAQDPESLFSFGISQPTRCSRAKRQKLHTWIVFKAAKSEKEAAFQGYLDSIDGELSVRMLTK
jgi:hypothetical protein